MSYAYDHSDDRGPFQRRRSRLPYVLLGVLLVALLVVGAVIVLPLLRPKTIAGADLAADVRHALEQNGGKPDDVTCEDATKVQRGAIVDCTASSQGETAGIRVTFDDDEGHFTVTAQAR